MQVGEDLDESRSAAFVIGSRIKIQVSKETREEDCPRASCGDDQDRLCIFHSSSLIGELDSLRSKRSCAICSETNPTKNVSTAVDMRSADVCPYGASKIKIRKSP